MMSTNSNQVLIFPGTADAPGLAFVGDPRTGVFGSKTIQDITSMNLTIGGNVIASFSPTSVEFFVPFTSTVAPEADIIDGFTRLKNEFLTGKNAVDAIVV